MKTKSIFIMVLAAVMLLGGCSSPDIPMPEGSDINKFGSGNGYVAESGIAKQGNNFYYTDIDGKKLFRYDGDRNKTYTLSSEEYAPIVYVKGDYVYRRKSELIGKVTGLVATKVDGSGERRILTDYDTSCFVLCGEKIYFSVTSEMQNPGTYSSDLSGNNIEYLCNYGSDNIFVTGNTLYFLKDNAVWSLDVTSKDVKKVIEYSSKGAITGFHKCGDKFIFVTADNVIEILELKSKYSKKINTGGKVSNSFCFNNKLWYNFCEGDNHSIKVINPDNFSVENYKNVDEYATAELFEDGVYICEKGSKFTYKRMRS